MTFRKGAVVALFGLLAGCAPQYALVGPGNVGVTAAHMTMAPAIAWNKAPASPLDIKWEENWTENGPLLDGITFIGGLPDGQAIVRQRRKDDSQVPIFHANMSPQDIVSMIEVAYRIRSGAHMFETKGVEPTTFLGHPGLAMNFAYVGQDEVKRRGRAIAAIVDTKLYMMVLDGAELHYFNAALPDFDHMASSASMH